MKNWHKEIVLTDDTNAGCENLVTIPELVKFFQMTTFKHSTEMGLDHKTMIEKSNAFWVVTKIKLVLNKVVESGEKLSITTWTHELGGVRAKRDAVIKSGKSLIAKANSEWCCLDFETRRLRKMNSIH